MTIYYLKRAPVDRRETEDMREAYSLDYFMDGGVERRKDTERRRFAERRKDWVRVTKWCSVLVGK